MSSICVIGLGYIGLPMASFLATKGFHVHGVDLNESIVNALNAGDVLIYEPSLDILVKSAVNSKRLTASTKPQEADIFILAVPTPFTHEHKPDLSYIQSACEAIAPYITHGNLVILESTSPVGTTEKVCTWLSSLRPDLTLPTYQNATTAREQVYVAHCPERVLPGKILEELVANDRIIGGVDVASTTKAMDFYKQIVHANVFNTTSRTAEFVKLVENSYRDVNIAFANELSMICDTLEIDVWEAIHLANKHPRVNILKPSAGVGGHCIAVDPWFIIDRTPEQAKLMHIARNVNDMKPQWIINKVKQKAQRFKNPRIACLGLAFKPNIDDLRESPAVYIVESLAQDVNISCFVVEPHIKNLPNQLKTLKNVQLVSLENAFKETDIFLLLVAHNQFKALNKDVLLHHIVFDACGLFV